MATEWKMAFEGPGRCTKWCENNECDGCPCDTNDISCGAAYGDASLRWRRNESGEVEWRRAWEGRKAPCGGTANYYAEANDKAIECECQCGDTHVYQVHEDGSLEFVTNRYTRHHEVLQDLQRRKAEVQAQREFRVGDWVVPTEEHAHKYTGKGAALIGRPIEISRPGSRPGIFVAGGLTWLQDWLRHATPEEIAEATGGRKASPIEHATKLPADDLVKPDEVSRARQKIKKLTGIEVTHVSIGGKVEVVHDITMPGRVVGTDEANAAIGFCLKCKLEVPISAANSINYGECYSDTEGKRIKHTMRCPKCGWSHGRCRACNELLVRRWDAGAGVARLECGRHGRSYT